MNAFELNELQMMRWQMTQGDMEFWGMQIVEGYRTMAKDLNQPELAELADYISANSRLGWEEVVIVGLGALGVLCSLFFMWSIRHPRIK